MAENAAGGLATDGLRARQVRIVIACIIGNAVSITPSVTAVFGVFLVPIATEFQWPRADIAFALTIIALSNAAMFPFVGRLVDQLGVRRVVLLGNPLLAAAIAALAWLPANRLIYDGLFALAGAAGSLSSGVILAKALSQSFSRHRGLALGLAAGLGNGIGSAVMPLAASYITLSFGWRTAYCAIAGLVLLLGFPVLFLLLGRRDPIVAASGTAPPSEGMTLAAALKMPRFWIILGGVSLGAGCMIGIFAHVVPILTDRGVSSEHATMILSALALSCAVWQSGVGALFDRTRSPRIAAPFFLSAIAGLALLEQATSTPALIAAALLLGVALGTEFGILGYLISRYFGLRAFGSISGAIYAAVLLSQAVSPYLMDVGFDMTGSYQISIRITEILLFFSAMSFFLLGNYPNPLEELSKDNSENI